MEQISSCTRSRSQQGAECDSSVVGAPVQTLSSESTRCCIQVLTAVVKLQLLDLVSQLQTQVAVKTSCFRKTAMSGHGSSQGRGRGDTSGGRSDDRSSRSSRSQSRAEGMTEKEKELGQKTEAKRDQYQAQAKEDEK